MKNFFTKGKIAFLALSGLLATNANAALGVIDTTAIEADITSAATAGVAIALAVAAAAIGVRLVYKLIR